MPDEKITFETASRSSAVPLIVIYGESGTGKTYSALLLATGIAAALKKPVRGIDTERGRMSLYADDPKLAGYTTAKLEEPYTPQRHIAYIDAAEEAAAGAIVLDSGSHEWEGTGGVLNQAGENEEKSGKPGLHNWKKPKEQHALFIAKLMRAKCPIIVCLRAKYKTRTMKGTKEMADQGLINFNQVGRQCIVKDQYVSPIQAEDFIFEATVHIQINQDHTIVVTKGGTPELRACFPKDNDGMITVEHGAAVARWIAGGGQRIGGPQKPAEPTTAATTSQAPTSTTPAEGTNDDPEAKKLRAAIWGATKGKYANGAALQQFLWDEGILSDTEELQKVSAARLTQILAAIQQP